ncbi:chromate transporter [Paraclostridium benzoelyticum]|uniref:chromate transporter n=1 Tax=Paraclostridium benzoelyticum TaxID=1629550 RepID=UPI0031CD3582
MSKVLMLFLIFFKIGSFSFGGGYAMLPFIQQEFIDKYHFITNKEFLDLLALSQSTPGPIAINSATFIGFKVGGFGNFSFKYWCCIIFSNRPYNNCKPI